MMGAPKCRSHTTRGKCIPGAINFVCGEHFFRCSINQKLPKVTKSFLLKQNGFVVAETESTKDSGCNARFTRARATTKCAGSRAVELGLK